MKRSQTERIAFTARQMIANKPIGQEAARRFDPYLIVAHSRVEKLTDYKPTMGMLGIMAESICGDDVARLTSFTQMIAQYPDNAGALYGVALSIGYALALADRADEWKRNQG